MIKNKSLLAILLMFGLVFTGCDKESFEDSPSHKSSTPTQKSNLSNMEMLGMAANLKDITYNNGQYDLSFYGTSESYSVVINSFLPDSRIDLSISSGSKTVKSVLDANAGSIEIDQISYRFSELQQTRITSSIDIILRATIGVIAHHIENPQRSITFIHNGDSDFFPDDPVMARRCFWCSSSKQHMFMEALNLCTTITTKTRFWVTTTEESDPHICE